MTEPRVLQTMFIKATNQCYRAIEESDTDFEEFKLFVTDKFCPQNTHIKQRHINELFAADEDFDDMFRTLTQHGLWDYQNSLLLRNITKKYLSKNTELTEFMRIYGEAIAGYREKTAIFDACELQLAKELPVEMNSPLESYFAKWNVKLESEITHEQLNHITDLSLSLASEIGLAPEALLLKKLVRNPLTVMWLVPTLFHQKVCDQMSQNQEWLKNKKVTYMALEECVLYPLQGGKVNMNATNNPLPTTCTSSCLCNALCVSHGNCMH